jgi:hypothetical protein
MTTGTGTAQVSGSQQDDNPNSKVLQEYTAGAGHTQTGKTGTAHNRNIAAALVTHPGSATDVNSETWSSSLGITELAVRCAAPTNNVDGSFLVVINAADGDAAKVLLEAAGGIGTDVLYESGYRGETLFIKRTEAITRLDIIPLAALGTSRFTIGAV